jgi:FkbM family methyltransferase
MEEALDYLTRTFGVFVKNVLNVGAYEGRHVEVLRKYCLGRIVLVEAVPEFHERLAHNIKGKPNLFSINALCSETPGILTSFYISSNEESSSMLEFSRHKDLYPHIQVARVDNYCSESVSSIIYNRFPETIFNVLVLETQGAALQILKGADDYLCDVEAIYVDVSEVMIYDNSHILTEILLYLQQKDFGMKWLKVNPNLHGYALFVRNNIKSKIVASKQFKGTNVAVGKSAQQSSTSKFSTPNDANGAINGQKTGSYGFHTEIEDCPWWKVDLHDTYEITEIVVFNRIDAAAHRSSSVIVSIGTDEFNWQIVHNQQSVVFGGIDGNPLRVSVPRERARFVKIQLATKDYLHLDEVEIYSEI